MKLICSVVVLAVCFVSFLFVEDTRAQNWRGNTELYQTFVEKTCKKCICWYSNWDCSMWRDYRCCEWQDKYRCKPGWKHNGNKNCDIPICEPKCNRKIKDAVCVAPGKCDCKGQGEGDFCEKLTCSWSKPCYPGNCDNTNKCRCTNGFTNKRNDGTDGCTAMTLSRKPYIGRSTAMISLIRSTNKLRLYNFLLDGTNVDSYSRTLWINQKRFNKLDFEFESLFVQPKEIPKRPSYVHTLKLGMIGGSVSRQVKDIVGIIKPGSTRTTPCPGGASQANPVGTTVYNCTVRNMDFDTQIEHGDTLQVTFRAKNGGYRKLSTTYGNAQTDYFDGEEHTKKLFFKFDFEAPKYCNESKSRIYCNSQSTMMTIQQEFTKYPIKVHWQGWSDDEHGSGMWLYYLELHKLVTKDATLELTEQNTVGPLKTTTVLDTGNDHYRHNAEFTPTEPGMYSILMEVRDKSNNSRIARRFVLYDPVSTVTLNPNSQYGLHVSSATKGSNYTWQNKGDPITVDWTGHFVNTLHADNHLLNEIKDFPTLFSDLGNLENKEQGILSVTKYVSESLDDHDGRRTQDAIANIQGIVKFEYAVVHTESTKPPRKSEYADVFPLKTSYTLNKDLADGDGLRIWIRAEDSMGNSQKDSTTVHIDTTPPRTDLTDVGKTNIEFNVGKAHNFNSRLAFIAKDENSGVRIIGLEITIKAPGKENKEYKIMVPANTDSSKDPTDIDCYETKDKSTCFIEHQTVNLDNCWFMVPNKEDLPTATASVNVLVYNQAMLTVNRIFKIGKIDKLSGLAAYSGPDHIRVTNIKSDSFRVTWDPPKVKSCYGSADILLKVTYKTENGSKSSEEFIVAKGAKLYDVGGRKPDTEYGLMFSTKLMNGGTTEGVELTAKTVGERVVSDSSAPIALIVGIAGGVIFLLIIAIVVIFYLARKGKIHPQQRARAIQQSVRRQYRQTIYGGDGTDVGAGSSNSKYKYDNRQSELYIYGGVDMAKHQGWHLDRDNIVFESLITSGRFANIYKAKMGKGHNTDTVAAKTLKENFTADDELLMKAKINFTGTVVGDHPNVLKFLGAVVSDDAMGPFIIYEYCEHGTLKDYLEQQRGNITIELQERLFKIGLDIARGMEYLASKDIVHRRLAARNILLTFLFDAKISGFGPQPNEDDSKADKEKRERIPIKWMAPECMETTRDATEASDVWSYAVVLWEIFSLGDTPYSNMRGRDLPSRIRKGERLSKPEQCDDTWYSVMCRCWNREARKRPIFNKIREELDSMFVAAPGDDYYYYQR